MGKFILLSLIVGTGLSALALPWIGIVSYYLLSLLGPQYIWWWNFEGLRVSLLVALFTISGIGINILKQKFDYRFLKTRLNLFVFLLWIFLSLSYFFGPFVNQFASNGRSPSQIFSLMNNILLFYFCATLAIDELKKIRYLSLVMVVSTLYLSYWANDQYFSGNWSQFNSGRLMGPRSIDGGTVYADENVFATFFVTGLPFVYYMSVEVIPKWLRYLLWALIPLGWHAIFLTGSRGGLIGIGVTLLLIVLLSRKKYLAFPLLLIALVFYQWQAGSVMKDRSESIVEYEGESSAEQRLAAWRGGLKMIITHPIAGVGLGSFSTALPCFSNEIKRVAHNTLIQFTAESGVVTGVTYLMILWTFVTNSLKIRNWCQEHEHLNETIKIELYNNASTVSFSGLITCSLFLSLNTYEIFFVLLVINNALLQICLRISEIET